MASHFRESRSAITFVAPINMNTQTLAAALLRYNPWKESLRLISI